MVGLVTRPLAIWLVGLALLVTTAGCKGEKDAKAATPPPPTEVVVAPVEQRAVAIERDFIARTEAVPTVEVRARVAGILEDVLFKEGMDVKKGQPLFIIQQAEYKAALETARAKLAKAQADLTRAKDTSIVERVRAQLAQRQADLEKARQDVNRYKPLAEARAIPQQDLDTSVAAEKVAAAGVDAQAAALKDAELAQRTQIQLSEAAVESAKASIIQADLNLGYTTINCTDRRHHRQDQRRSRQPRGQGGADTARHRVQGEPDLRRFLGGRGRLHPLRAPDQPQRPARSAGRSEGAARALSLRRQAVAPEGADRLRGPRGGRQGPGPSAYAPSFPTPTS